MKLVEITTQKSWDDFMSSRPRSQFTQSWDWGEFRVSRGEEVRRIALEDGGAWLAAASFIFYPKRLMSGYWYAPRGPVVAGSVEGVLPQFTDALRGESSLAEGFFLRIEPPVLESELSSMPAGFIRSHEYMPATTLLLDLSKSEDALLAAMHEKTRYNIRLAAKKGVTVREGKTDADLETFLRLNEETADRDKFTSLSTSYIRDTYQFLHPRSMARIRLAEHKGNALAASMEMHFGDTATYLYGASSSASRNVMAPYALHWDAIRSAKQEEKRFYDLHGINPSDKGSSYYKTSWEGITRFKLGFGGERAEYAGTWELPRRPLLYRLLRTLSRTYL